MSTDEETANALDRVVNDLSYRYDGVLREETVDRYVHESYDRLKAHSKVDAFLPLLTEKYARDRLAALARAEGKLASGTPEVLFVCVRNAGRSQMAAALMDHHSGGRVHVRSAGSQPDSAIPAVVTEAMAEVGIQLTNAYPKPLTDDFVRGSDVVVTMGCGDACPIFPGRVYLDWDLPNPHGQPIEVVRSIRDQIDAHVRELQTSLLVNPAATTSQGSEVR
jgi:arsenate reductase (thioredoxin)